MWYIRMDVVVDCRTGSDSEGRAYSYDDDMMMIGAVIQIIRRVVFEDKLF